MTVQICNGSADTLSLWLVSAITYSSHTFDSLWSFLPATKSSRGLLDQHKLAIFTSESCGAGESENLRYKLAEFLSCFCDGWECEWVVVFICFCVLFGKCSIFEVNLYIAYNSIRAVNGTHACRSCRSGVHLNSFFRSATSGNLSHSHSPPPVFSCSNFQNPKICPNKFCGQFLLCNLNYQDNSPFCHP